MNATSDKKFLQTQRSNYSNRKQTERMSTSRYKSPDSRSTSSQLSVYDSFQVSIKHIIPLTNKLKQQNQFFSSSKQKLNKELALVYSLSESLIIQNKQLRQHDKHRTGDMQHLVNTLIINNKQQISDGKHVLFCVKEHNQLYHKKIAEKYVSLQQNAQDIKNMYEKLNNQIKQNSDLQKALDQRQVTQSIRSRHLHKDISCTFLNQLQRLQTQGINIALNNYLLKNQNLQKLRILRRNKCLQSPAKLSPIQISIYQNTNKRYHTQLQQNQYNQINQHQFFKNKNLKLTNQNIKTRLNKLISQNQAKRIKINILAEKNRNYDRNDQKINESCSKIQKTSLQKHNILTQLISQISNKKEHEIKLKQSINSRKIWFQKDYEQKLVKIKQSIAQQNNFSYQYVSKSIMAPKNQIIKKLSQKNYQLQVLQAQANQLKQQLLISSRTDRIEPKQ